MNFVKMIAMVVQSSHVTMECSVLMFLLLVLEEDVDHVLLGLQEMEPYVQVF